jgi:hypothetical protein
LDEVRESADASDDDGEFSGEGFEDGDAEGFEATGEAKEGGSGEAFFDFGEGDAA